jgi:hypothetical protein
LGSETPSALLGAELYVNDIRSSSFLTTNIPLEDLYPIDKCLLHLFDNGLKLTSEKVNTMQRPVYAFYPRIVIGGQHEYRD